MATQFQTENINTWITELNSEAKAAVSVDCVIFGYDEKELSFLQIECNMPPHEGKMSLIGDLVRSNETLDEAARRVLEMRTGLTGVYMEQVKAFSGLNRHPLGRVISVAYYSLIKIDNHTILDNQSKALNWVPIKEVDEMAFDHMQILNECLNTLRVRLREKPIGFSLLPRKFSLIQLQNLYEIILDIRLDKRNFRRKLHNSGILIDLEENQTDVAHRPAKLYSFDYERFKATKSTKPLKFDI